MSEKQMNTTHRSISEQELNELLASRDSRRKVRYLNLDKFKDNIRHLLDTDVSMAAIGKWLEQNHGEHVAFGTLKKFVVRCIGQEVYDSYLARNGWTSRGVRLLSEDNRKKEAMAHATTYLVGNNIVARVREVIRWCNNDVKFLEELTRIKAACWQEVIDGPDTKITPQVIEKLGRAWPELVYWLVTGIDEAPVAQLSGSVARIAVQRALAARLLENAGMGHFAAALTAVPTTAAADNGLDYVRTPITELGVSRATVTALKNNGLKTVGELCALREKDLLHMLHVGKTRWTEITNRLAVLGLALREDN